ncbi:hypothetical protein XGA_1202 [Xanthomonas hortorum ATCC 19865]|nr:hypothetical protein XGA_1202 [Xanthomonas hortorum ATCC 19865]
MRMRPAASGTTHCWASTTLRSDDTAPTQNARVGRRLATHAWARTLLAGIQWRIDSNATGQVLVPIQLHALLAIDHQRAPIAIG